MKRGTVAWSVMGEDNKEKREASVVSDKRRQMKRKKQTWSVTRKGINESGKLM